MKKFLFTAAAFLTMSATTIATTQVTIGSTANPQSFSILELESNGARGMRLPQMTTAQRNALGLENKTGTEAQKAQGLQIFNTKTRCIETWNGTKWIQKCGEPDPWVEIPACECSDMTIPPVRFAKYNLGADSTLDTPKKQMGYLVSKSYSSVNDQVSDARVYGGLYQWGRKWEKDKSYQVSVDGSYLRTYNQKLVWLDFRDVESSNGRVAYDATGQILTVGGNQTSVLDATNAYVMLKDTETSDRYHYDWRGKYYSATSNLWGNGSLMTSGATDKGGILYNGNYYQNTNWTYPSNNPCPAGFRVPTQDEWERIINYDCNPTSYTGRYISISQSGGYSATTNNGLVWVRVVCTHSTGKCVPGNGYSTSAHNGSGTVENIAAGLAVYDSEVWGNADPEYKKTDGSGLSLHSDAAPEPLLFFPCSGFYYDYEIRYTTRDGLYWTATTSNYESLSATMRTSEVGVTTRSYRTYSLSIRCVVK
jgi:hypothetical protein